MHLVFHLDTFTEIQKFCINALIKHMFVFPPMTILSMWNLKVVSYVSQAIVIWNKW